MALTGASFGVKYKVLNTACQVFKPRKTTPITYPPSRREQFDCQVVIACMTFATFPEKKIPAVSSVGFCFPKFEVKNYG
ncbi:BTB and CNC homology 1 [Echinococcus multilocularis]|uniref:BTB and CNC homology 1 n=1 Tax=Echinococcus multilocularis TaxID=6211 RepID=A0A0S4MN59_ECHMU|nr:BTB and CNC homology 1 [Echinococcus multilocularis]